MTDQTDDLAFCRERFVLEEGVVYLDGNSLGPLTSAAAEAVAKAVHEEWGQGLIRSWNDAGWMTLAERTGDKIARLLGAPPRSVICADSTSVNLYKALEATLSPSRATLADRTVVLLAEGDFPTDRYLAEAVAARHGASIRAVVADELIGALDDRTAVVATSVVDYRTSQLVDVAALTAAAHRAGALTVFDLSHAAGVLDLALAHADVDVAVGCGYKFLNGGPGAPAFIYVAPRIVDLLQSPLPGWFGHAEPFAFEAGFRPVAGIGRFQVGTPPIMSLVALHAALSAFDGVSPAALRSKSVALTSSFVDRFAGELAPRSFTLESPVSADQRGSHIALGHPEGYAIVQALIARGVIGDFRPPNLLRFGFAPLYNSFTDVAALVDGLVDIVDSRAHDNPEFRARKAVT